MNIETFVAHGHTISVAFDAPYWKSKVDHGIWSPGSESLGAELQSVMADVQAERNPLEDLNPDRLHPPTSWLREQTVYDDDAGVYYEPFVQDGRVGYRVASNRPGIGLETFLYFNPSGGSDDGVPTVFVYQGVENDPAQDASQDFHIVIEDVGYEPAEEPAPGAEAEHAAWVAERLWLAEEMA